MPFRFSNNSSTTLAASLASGALSLTVSAGTGALFPALSSGETFNAVLMDSSNNLEIVQVTARSADTFTIVRAQEGTTARSFSSGDRVELRMTAAALANFVQLDGAQTITGAKTFSNMPTFSAGQLPVANGGTGVSTLSGVAFGNGAGAFTAATGAQIAAAIGASVVTNSTNATLAAKASTLASGGANGSAMTFTWDALGSQPTYLWGGSDIGTQKVFAASSLSVLSATRLIGTNWSIVESGGALIFQHNGAAKVSIDSAGKIETVGTVVANG
jgi:hypothetical protein